MPGTSGRAASTKPGGNTLITRTSRGTKRFMAAAAAVAMIGSTLAISSSAMAGPGIDAPGGDRFSGADRYATAADVADEVFGGNDDITVVNGESFPDGLASAIYGDAVLLTQADSIPAATAAWLEANCVNVTGVRVIGGVAAVSSAVVEELAACAPVTRIAGTNRYTTAIEVADNFNVGNPTSIILATGENFPDALAAGPLAIATGSPILLNNGDSLRAEVSGFLNAQPQITDVYIVGGEAVISAEIEAELAGPRGYNVTRLAGDTRADTAVAVAEELGAVNVVLVNGSGFADALSAGPLAAVFGAAILVVNADSIPAATAAVHIGNCNTIGTVDVVGGTSVVSASVKADAVAAATCAPVGITSATLTVDDVQQRTIALDDDATGLALNAVDVTLTAIEVGALANDWAVSFADGAVAGAVVDATAGTIVYTDAFGTGLLSQTQFISNFNSSDAGAFFEAGLNTGGDGDLLFGDVAHDVLDTAGSSDYTVVVTFNQKVEEPGAGGAPAVVPTLSTNQNPNINGNFTVTNDAALVLGAGGWVGPETTLTYLWDDNAEIVPDLSTGSIKFDAASLQGSVTLVPNAAESIGAL
jgi:putative cell wall-binding protein